jgi:heavy metal translocating P-type ATPase
VDRLNRIVREWGLAALVLAGLAVGGVLHLHEADRAAHAAWGAAAGIVLGPLAWGVARRLLQLDVGVDAIALVAIATALALGEYLAAAIVSLMLAGGNALEASAGSRARRELRRLAERAPRSARRRRDDVVEEVPVDDLMPGDIVVVRAGDVLPTDGAVTGATEAVIDESALTGEPLPVTIRVGGKLRSGTSNAGDVFEMLVEQPAARSAYAAIVRMVEAAALERAPFVRLADRYAAIFLPVTLAAAAAAGIAAGDSRRGLAVLVVATPCPLILAAPVALISGLSRAARVGVVVKGGGAIERLGRARTVLFDKTGTLTLGTPMIDRLVELNRVDPGESLRLAASLDQLSAHVYAEALVRAATERGLALSTPSEVLEEPGQGILGLVDGRRVVVGTAAWLERAGLPGARAAGAAGDVDGSGQGHVFVGVDGTLAAMIVMADHLREDAAPLVGELRQAGIRHVALVTGDRRATAEEVGRRTGVDRVYAEQTPQDKLGVVRALRGRADLSPVVMVGDGVNDAPALALADVGIALGAQGVTVSSETADVVITLDRIDRVGDAVRIGRRSLHIARQSVLVGMGLSGAAMVVAGLGYLPPVWGALFQEGIDVAVILNALRALRDGPA